MFGPLLKPIFFIMNNDAENQNNIVFLDREFIDWDLFRVLMN
jgi:hypothetical protein